MNINVTGLNPYSRYNVNIRLIAQYEGLHNELGGDSFKTSEDGELLLLGWWEKETFIYAVQ